jgi:uncharacterized membrane protein
MDWFNKHLNWTYVFVLIIGYAIMAATLPALLADTSVIPLAFVIGMIVAFILTMAGSAWILRKKGQSLWFLALAFVFFFALVILALVLPNNKSGQAERGKISDSDYYKSRGADVK